MHLAGFDACYHFFMKKPPVLNETIISELVSFYDETGRVPTKDDCNRNKFSFNQSTATRKFGTWNHALRAAGLPVHTQPTPRITVECKQCQTFFNKKQGEINKSPNHFCSSSCAATYNNTHKSTGIRRSKLEQELESILRMTFPKIQLVCNSLTVIEYELDFYFPELRFAIEFNGIFHYEPIYGTQKLERIQFNDKQKLLLCTQNGIELCILNTSSVKTTNAWQIMRYAAIVISLVESLLGRSQSIGTQDQIRTDT